MKLIPPHPTPPWTDISNHSILGDFSTFAPISCSSSTFSLVSYLVWRGSLSVLYLGSCFLVDYRKVWCPEILNSKIQVSHKFPCYFQQISMILPTNFHVTSNEFPWYFQQISMILPTNFHDTSNKFPYHESVQKVGSIMEICWKSQWFPWSGEDTIFPVISASQKTIRSAQLR